MRGGFGLGEKEARGRGGGDMLCEAMVGLVGGLWVFNQQA